MIWMDTFVFKRTWEENIKFVIYVHDGDTRMPSYYTEMNLRDLFDVGRYMAKKIELKDDHKNYSGYLIVDVNYKEEEEKPKEPPLKVRRKPEVSPEEKEQMQRMAKQEQIKERMRKREM